MASVHQLLIVSAHKVPVLHIQPSCGAVVLVTSVRMYLAVQADPRASDEVPVLLWERVIPTLDTCHPTVYMAVLCLAPGPGRYTVR